MRPFSLKHRMALHAVESPFVVPGKEMSLLDLFVAVKICAEKPIRSLSFMDVFRMSAIKAKPKKIGEYVDAFHEYSNISYWPKFWNQRKKQGGSARTVPWILQVISNLIANGWEEEAAWSLPESQAIWYHTAISIRNGNDVSLMNEDDDDIISNFKQLAEEAKAKPRIRKHTKLKPC